MSENNSNSGMSIFGNHSDASSLSFRNLGNNNHSNNNNGVSMATAHAQNQTTWPNTWFGAFPHVMHHDYALQPPNSNPFAAAAASAFRPISHVSQHKRESVICLISG